MLPATVIHQNRQKDIMKNIQKIGEGIMEHIELSKVKRTLKICLIGVASILLVLVVSHIIYSTTHNVGADRFWLHGKTSEEMSSRYILLAESDIYDNDMCDKIYQETPMEILGGPIGILLEIIPGVKNYFREYVGETRHLIYVTYDDGKVISAKKEVVASSDKMMRYYFTGSNILDYDNAIVQKADIDKIETGMTIEEVTEYLGITGVNALRESTNINNILTYKISDNEYAHIVYKSKIIEGNVIIYADKVYYNDSAVIDRFDYAYKEIFNLL